MPPVSIDHNIPLQPSHRGRPCGSKTRYPFNQMEVGDSFIVVADRVHSVRVIIGRRKDVVDTSLATTAMPIVAGAQPNYFLLHTRATPPK